MAHYQIMSWHGIPTGVKAVDTTGQVREKLPMYFQVAVDAVATATGRMDPAGYLSGWQWSEPIERQGTAKEVAQVVVAELIASFPPKQLKALRQELEIRLATS
ncbi:MAG: hypothetical protein DPW09_24135 [Anaerolineae bacterium]|nr:hypothetical protein [Anaerolineae bacterium]